MSDLPAKRVVGRPFKKGEGGRKLGSRQYIAKAFLDALRADFDKHGAAALAKMRDEDPSTYIRMVARLLPTEVTGADGGPVATEVVYRWAVAGEDGPTPE
ncbi:MAG: hypothetical protein B7Z66_15285 [Chromatiales bacterium 21-64-14]|nr:MAG: hypothetical protein B7Z66_15285 [Chromatiales bacterium 21-64-14]